MSKEYAFPRTPGHEHPTYTGITTRDYFAAKAMQGIIACTPEKLPCPPAASAAERAYRYADAMMEARK
jgi:hypothetical protein